MVGGRAIASPPGGGDSQGNIPQGDIPRGIFILRALVICDFVLCHFFPNAAIAAIVPILDTVLSLKSGILAI